MTTTERLIIEVLAAADAAWFPLRREEWESPAARANLYALRRDFPTKGVPWRSGEALANERKAAQRLLESAASGGLVHLYATGGRTSGVGLTDRGEAVARAKAGLPSIGEAREVLARLAALAPAGCWVAETCIAANDPAATWTTLGPTEGKLLWQVSAALAPLAARGLVQSNSDLQGHVYYRLTEAGVDWLAGPVPEPMGDSPQATAKAMKHYDEAFQDARDRLRSDAVEIRELGFIPLAVSGPLLRAPNGIDPVTT